jgi:hypothetical protein
MMQLFGSTAALLVVVCTIGSRAAASVPFSSTA